ncbi:granzyme A-like, partial [Pyxicephalus adspersus]|uniref:granzyme A-like n=1 Tax=Pyxicephalus adspersus TaxID=30357 RepID=UPI003B5BA45E
SSDCGFLNLLQLSGKAKPTKAVKILPLPKIFSDVKDGTMCDTAGWGATTSNGQKYPNKLMEVKLPAISRKKCATKWRPEKITKNMMCTFDARGKKDACVGDSGGPLLCRKTLRGIVSFGPKNCADRKLPGVYTFLTKAHVNWIKEKIKQRTNTTY